MTHFDLEYYPISYKFHHLFMFEKNVNNYFFSEVVPNKKKQQKKIAKKNNNNR